MNSPFKMKPGRGSMQKTGRGIPTSLCSPNMQRKDAKTGKEVPEGAVYGKTVVSVDKYGSKVYTTPYEKKGTSTKTSKSYKQFAAEGGDLEAAKKWNAKDNAGVKGTVEIKSIPLTTATIKPFNYNIEAPEIIVKKQRSLTPSSSTKGYQTDTGIGKIKKFGNKIIDNINIPSTDTKTKRGGCFTN